MNLILGLLDTGLLWKGLPIPQDAQGKLALPSTTVYRAFAKWADDGALWQAFVVRVRHLADAKPLDLSVLLGAGTNTVAQKGGRVLETRGTNPRLLGYSWR